ncbi:hypothetical protein [Saezia sanguinis]|uniref:hypothetical protein n=1 Tax=Saezia sanguinis TaxID=1965230 RepID=UPI00306C1A9C
MHYLPVVLTTLLLYAVADIRLALFALGFYLAVVWVLFGVTRLFSKDATFYKSLASLNIMYIVMFLINIVIGVVLYSYSTGQYTAAELQAMEELPQSLASIMYYVSIINTLLAVGILGYSISRRVDISFLAGIGIAVLTPIACMLVLAGLALFLPVAAIGGEELSALIKGILATMQ